MIIDVSHFQYPIDWSKVNKNVPAINGVFIKATQGVGYTDPKLKENAKGASEVGLAIGYYHYASINTHNYVKDAIDEATYFISVVKTLPVNTLPLVLDIEENKAHLAPNEILGWIKCFFGQLDNLGYSEYLLYSYTPFLNANLPENHGLGNIDLWIAAYVNQPTPRLPIGWNKYHLWQYTAKGRVSGILSDVDCNKYPS